MKGNIRERGQGTWEIHYDVPRDENNKRRQKTCTVHGTKRDAERELNRLIHEANSGGFVDSKNLTVAGYMKQWLATAKENVAASTYFSYEVYSRQHIVASLGRHQLAKLQPLHIQAMYTNCLTNGRIDGKGGLSPQSVLHIHRILKEAMGQAVKWQLIARNPVDAVDPPRVPKTEMMFLKQDQVTQLLAQVRDSLIYIPVLLAVTTGMRRGELLGLRWDDIDFTAKTLAVRRSLQQTNTNIAFKETKTASSRRVIALPPFVVEALVVHKGKQAEQKLLLGEVYEDSGLVCTHPDGRLIQPNHLSHLFDVARNARGWGKLRFHDLRHTHATLLLQQGVHPKVVQERLGHSSIATTLNVYSHVLPSMQEDAANKIDAMLAVRT